MKSHQLTKSGKTLSEKISDAYKACYMLEKIDAKKKSLILTDREFYEMFKRYSDGKISEKIEIILLANKMQARKPCVAKATLPLNKAEKSNLDLFWLKLTSWLSKKRHITDWTLLRGETGEDFDGI